MHVDPINGMCSDREYGAMSDWDTSNVTSLSKVFIYRTEFNGNISSWDVNELRIQSLHLLKPQTS